MDSSISDDDLTTAYLLGAEHMRDKLHKQAEEIERLKAENEKLREVLKPFAYKYQDNSLSHSMYIFEMKDLLAAKKALV